MGWAVLWVLILLPGCGLADDAAAPAATKKQEPMPIYVTPYYNSQGPVIRVGPLSEELIRADSNSILKLSEKMKLDRNKLPAETMHVLAIRLYDLGRKDEAVYWFYSAEVRRWLFKRIVNQEQDRGIGWELVQAQHAFQTLSGVYINGYGFGDLPKLSTTLKTVRSEAKDLPDWSGVYPGVVFVNKAAWSDKNKEVLLQLDEALEYIEKHADEIKAARKQNGIEGKY